MYHYLAWKRLASELGFDFAPDDNEALKGVSRMDSLNILLKTGGMQDKFTEEEKTAMASQKNQWYIEYISGMTPNDILPGVLSFLQELKRHHIKTALGSASKNASLLLDKINISDLFDAVVDGKMIDKAKPDPQVFLLGAELLRAKPSACVVFEDAEAGIEAAQRAGMHSVGIGESHLLKNSDLQIDSFENFTYDRLVHLYQKQA
jgi:beta-phosphoglucomutase